MSSSLFTNTTSFVLSSFSTVANISSTSFVSVSETQSPSQSPVKTPISASLSNNSSLSFVPSLAVITSPTSTIQRTSTSPRLSTVLVSDAGSSTSKAQSMGASSTSTVRFSTSLPAHQSSLLSTTTVSASTTKSNSTPLQSPSHSSVPSTATSEAAPRTEPVNIVNTMTSSAKPASSSESPKSTQKAPPAPTPPPKPSSTPKPPPPHTSNKPTSSSHSPSHSPSPPPPPPRTTSSQRSTSVTSNAAPSTTLSVSVVGPSSTSTSTFTTTPQTTLSNLVALTITNASDGRTSLSTPALITIISTSTEPDGALVTLTNIVANSPLPNNGAESLSGKKTGFLQNQGAVAGVFVVVGIVAATLVAGIFFCVRHKRRIARRRQWIAGMQRMPPSPLTGDPFQDPADPPVAAYEANDDSNAQWAGRSGVRPMAERPGAAASGLAGVGSEMHSQHPRGLLFNETHLQRPAPGFLGVPFPNDRLREMTQSAQSTPSIYPVSLLDDDYQSPRHPEPLSSVPPPVDIVPPPRPPRSNLRDSVQYNHFNLPAGPSSEPQRPPRSSLRNSVKYKHYDPLTPPSSDPPTPIDEAQTTESQKNLFVRRPVPEVRPYQTRDWS